MDDRGDAPRAAVVPADEHHVGAALCHARRHRSHARLGHELHEMRASRFAFSSRDELRQIFYGINVVVRGRRNKHDAGHAVPDLGYRFVHLFPGSWPPSPGLAPCAILICARGEFTR